MITYTLTTPASVGSLSNPIVISSFQLTGINFTSTPPLAAIGTGELTVTLTETSTGWQERLTYKDATVLGLWAAIQSPPDNTSLGDIIAAAVFAKLVVDGRLPPGSITTS